MSLVFQTPDPISEIRNWTMLLYVLIGLCLSLAGVAGLQLMYMFYLDRLDKQRKKHLHDLQLECRRLTNRLVEVENELNMKNEILAVAYPDFDDEEAWADVIEER
jgi:hypothetical protein